jgi:hypothetical protein
LAIWPTLFLCRQLIRLPTCCSSIFFSNGLVSCENSGILSFIVSFCRMLLVKSTVKMPHNRTLQVLLAGLSLLMLAGLASSHGGELAPVSPNGIALARPVVKRDQAFSIVCATSPSGHQTRFQTRHSQAQPLLDMESLEIEEREEREEEGSAGAHASAYLAVLARHAPIVILRECKQHACRRQAVMAPRHAFKARVILQL